MRRKLYVYDELIDLLQTLHQAHPDKGYDDKALEIFERKQGRVFLEEIGQSGARRFAGLPDRITQQEQSLAQQLVKTQTDLALERAKPFLQQNRARIDSLTQKLATLKNEQAALEAHIKEKYPKYYALKYPQPASLATLQNEVLQAGEMMLVYGVMEDSTVLWVINQDKLTLFTLSLSETEIEQQVSDFRQAISAMQRAIEQSGQRGFTRAELEEFLEDRAEDTLPEVLETSHRLYQNLLPVGARKLLAQAQLIYVVPTGPLYALPFEALVTTPVEDNEDESPHYLIKDHAIAYLSSASLLKTLREAQSRRQTKAPQPLLAFADPVFPPCADQKNHRRGTSTDNFISLRSSTYRNLVREGCFQPLPETEEEVTEIAKWLNAPTKHALKLRETASYQTVQDLKLDDYQYLVFATHAVLPDETDGVNQSALVMSHTEPDDEKAFLTMADVFALQLNADFVTLSACNTGGGKHIKGDGIRGLTRAFMYAGTPAVSVTLWSVESQSAKTLSTGIFERLQKQQNLAEALRQIKLAMLRGKRDKVYESHPYFWAPFVIWGDGAGKRIP